MCSTLEKRVIHIITMAFIILSMKAIYILYEAYTNQIHYTMNYFVLFLYILSIFIVANLLHIIYVQRMHLSYIISYIQTNINLYDLSKCLC